VNHYRRSYPEYTKKSFKTVLRRKRRLKQSFDAIILDYSTRPKNFGGFGYGKIGRM